MDLEDAEMSVKFVLHDRDASFTAAFGAVFQAAGVRVVRSAIQAPRMDSIMERWIGSCRRELLDRTLIWNQRHLMTVLREYEDFYNTHRPHHTLNQAVPLRPLPGGVTDLDHFRVRRRDRAAGTRGHQVSAAGRRAAALESRQAGNGHNPGPVSVSDPRPVQRGSGVTSSIFEIARPLIAPGRCCAR